MKKLLALAVACGAAASVTNAQIIVYELRGTVATIAGGDAQGLNGASFLMTCNYDASGVYIERFGFATVDGTGTVDIGGNVVGFNSDVGFYPTFAGTFSSPDGLQNQFNMGGTTFEMIGNTTPTPGAADAVIGGPIELDDFAPGGTYSGADGGLAFYDIFGQDQYTLRGVSIDAYIIPAPGALAMLGIGGLVATRRRR